MKTQVWAALAISVLAANVAWAQAETPPREGNRWDGKAHPATQGSVTDREDHAGIAPTPQQQRQEDKTLRQIDRKLQQTNGD
jgi:hypothetical protein